MNVAGVILSILAIAMGLGVVISRNPLYSAFCLVGNLIAVAGLYAVLGAHFLAVAQIIVYAGAVMVLVLFVLMLLNIKSDEGVSKAGLTALIVSVLTAIVVACMVLPAILGGFELVPAHEVADRAARAQGSVRNIGVELFGRYIVQFELASLVLLIGVVGAVVLGKRKTSTLGPRVAEVGEK